MADTKQVVRTSAPKEGDYQGEPGYFQDYQYDDGTVERRFFYEDGSSINGVLVSTWTQELPKPPPTEGDTAAERRELELEAQRKRNAGLPADQDPAYETDAERRARAHQVQQAQEAATARAEAARRAEATEVRQEAAEARAAASASRPTMISPGATRRTITTMGPGGELSTQPNPEFDEPAYERAEAQARAKAARDALALQIQAGQLTEQTAASEYKRWFDANVTIPLQRSQEARARATELRQAQEAEDRRQQFAASYTQQRESRALSAGEAAASAFNQNLQYQVGPEFGEQFAQALNSFQPGAPPAQFTADAFTFKGPSIESVARKATAQALSTISPYAKAIAAGGQRELQTAQYDEGMMPQGMPMGPPPMQAAAPDYNEIVNQFLSTNPYQGAPTEEEEGE